MEISLDECRKEIEDIDLIRKKKSGEKDAGTDVCEYVTGKG
jgi:hypothetical protein